MPVTLVANKEHSPSWAQWCSEWHLTGHQGHVAGSKWCWLQNYAVRFKWEVSQPQLRLHLVFCECVQKVHHVFALHTWKSTGCPLHDKHGKVACATFLNVKLCIIFFFFLYAHLFAWQMCFLFVVFGVPSTMNDNTMQQAIFACLMNVKSCNFTHFHKTPKC